MKKISANSSGRVTAIAKMSERTMSTPRRLNSVRCDPIRSGTCWGRPYHSEPTF
jgi:hypothetical protein